MRMTRDNFQEVLTPVHRQMFYDQYDELPEQFSRVFSVEDMVQKTESVQRLGGFGLWDTNTEGNTINEDEMHEGETIEFTAVRRDKGYEVTWELAQDDLYGVFSGKGKGGSAQNLAMGLNATIETAAANVLNDGMANTGYDGKALFATDHPLIDAAGALSNKTTGALADSTLKVALQLMRAHVNDAGIKIMAVPKQLIVPAALEYTANAIMFSAGITGVSTNDKNTIPGMEIVVMDYLNSDVKYYVKAGNIKNLVFKWREAPWFDTQQIPKTVDFFAHGYARWTEGYEDVRGLVGSTGA